MLMPSPLAPSTSLHTGKARIERDLAVMTPGQRQFFRLVIGTTRMLFVPLWLGLGVEWAWRCLILTLSGSPRSAFPPRPGFERLEMPGYWLYLVGAYVAVVIGFICMVGLCFLPVITVFSVVSALREQESLSRVLGGILGAAALESLMLLVYFRYMRGVLSER